jgi:two-component system, OmpR family, sensor histidine kinase VicK
VRFLRSGLFRKFAAVMAGLAVIPVCYLAYHLSEISQRGIENAVLELHTKLAEKMAEQVDGFFKVNDEKLSFALASLRKDMAWADKQEILTGLIDTHADVIELSLVNADGTEMVKIYNPELTSDADTKSRADEEGFQRFLETRIRTMTLSKDPPSLKLYYPLTPKVLARIHISLKGLAGRVSGERVGGTGFAILVDQKGEPLFYPSERLSEAMRAQVSKWGIVTAALQAQSTGSKEFVDPATGMAFVGAYAPVEQLHGAIVILQPRDEAYVAALQMKRTSLIVLAAVLLIACVSAWIFAKKLTAPLLALTRSAEAVSRGDFSARVDIQTHDELHDLAETFNRMTGQLRSYAEMQVDRVIGEQRKTGAILFSIDEGILMADQAGKIQLANRRATEFMGAAGGQSLEGKTVEEACAEPLLRKAMLQAAGSSKPGTAYDLSVNEGKLHLRVTAFPVISPGATASTGLVLAIRDVTLEKELDKMKEEFLHYITHDLRNPLGSAMGFIEVLLKGLVGVLNPEQYNMVASIQRSTSRLMGMINNILDIAKMESGKVRLNIQTVSVTGVACRAIGILESLAQQKKVTVNLNAIEEFSTEADGDQLERIFTNLLGNAIKYTPVGGTITIHIVDQGPELRCCVEDSGEGIPEAYLKRVFEKFEQVTGQRKGGTGLGLTITKYFVEAHRGKIWVESEVGKGSRFYFTVPKGLAVDEEGDTIVRQPEKVA